MWSLGHLAVEVKTGTIVASTLTSKEVDDTAAELDFGAEIRVWADFALSRRGQATRRETGMPRPVMMLMTLQATLASVFCVGRVRAWRPRPITFL